MVDVTCPGCSASYSLSEKRIPDAGMEMRCPQCSATFQVQRPGQTAPAPHEGAAPARTPIPMPHRKRHSLFSSRPAPPNKEFHSPAVDDLFGDADDDDGFGVIDMALPGGELPLGGPDSIDGDLPIAATDLDLPMAAADLNLPAVAYETELPTVAPQTDLPTVRHHDQVGLPAVADPAGTLLPSARRAPRPHGGRPPPGASGPAQHHGDNATVPLPPRHGAGHSEHQAFDELNDLPLPSDFSNLPSAVAHGDLPMPAAHADLPMPADQDLPLPAPNADLPLPADFDFPAASNAPPRSHGLGQPPSQPFDPHHDQFELADDPLDRLGQTASMANPDLSLLDDEGAHGHRTGQDRTGQEASLDTEVDDSFGDEFDLEGAAEKQPGAAGQAPKVRLRRKPSKTRKAALVAIPLLAVAGGMLYMVPSIGAFGNHAISDFIHRDSQAQAYRELSQQTNQQLGLDTAAGAQLVSSRARTLVHDMPRHTPVVATAAFLAFWNEVRFGTGSQDVAAGKQLLATLKNSDNDPSKELASIAQQATGADPEQVYRRANGYTQRYPNSFTAAALAGEMALRAKKPQDALGHYQTLAKTTPTALAAYGMARAYMALQQQDKAQRQTEQTLELSQYHAGARTLLATILWMQNNKDDRPLKLVQEVVAEGPVRQAASRAELVLAYSLSGEIELSRAHMTAAEKAFERALKMDPQSQRALLGNGEMLYQAGRYSEALARFEAAHRPNPKAELPLVGKAKTKIALEHAADAKAELLPIAKTSKHPLVGYWLGRAEEALGNSQAAEKWYRHALAVGAKRADAVNAYVALADLLRGQGRHQEAAAVLSDAIENLPRSVALHNARGDVALTSGRIADAKREFLSALKIDPSFTPSRFRLATAMRQNHEFAAAEAALKKVVDSDPAYPGLALERGLLFEAQGDTDKALAMYKEALEKAPDDVDLKLRIGSAQVRSGHPKQAAKLLREVLAKRPRSAEVNYFLGRAQLLNGEYVDALRYLQTAVRYDNNRAEYHLYVAWAANESGQIAIASKAVDAALALDQNMGDAYWQRAVVKQKYGRTRDALIDLKRALELNPTRYEGYATMALCYQDQADYKAAEEAWRKAISGNDKVAEWHFRLGKILSDRGARGEAAKHLEAAIALAKTSKRPSGWLWSANLLLGEALRQQNPKRAIVAYRAFIRLSSADNAYRPEAEKALAALEKR